MERFVNGKEFQRLFNEANPDSHMVIQRRCSCSKKLKRCMKIVFFHLRMSSQ